MRHRRLLAATALVAIGTGLHGSAMAQSPDVRSANYMLPGCRELVQNPGVGDRIFFQGLCMGVVGSVAVFGKQGQIGVCVPPGVQPQQSVRVVVAYIDSRPARMHEDFYNLAVEALREAWPCR